MSTKVIYNGITISGVVTRQWDQEVVYDESDTDSIGQRYSFQFDGIIHAQDAPIADSPVYTSSASGGNSDVLSILAVAQDRLSKPRGELEVYIGDTLVVHVVPSAELPMPPHADTNNGPRPTVLSITPMGTRVIRVSFSIEAQTASCSGYGRRDDEMVLSNRWRLSESMDANYHTTRTITGKLRLAAGMFKPGRGVPAHLYKPLVLPPLEDSFRRDRMVFSAEPDGLSCSYEITDRQVHQAAPWPATQMSATHTEASNHGTFFTSDMNVRLTGDAACDKRLLLERALQILESRLRYNLLENASTVESFSITDHIGDQAVIEASARIKRVGVDKSPAIVGVNLDRLGKNLELPPLTNYSGVTDGSEYNSQLSRVPQPYGYKASSGATDWERRPAVLVALHVYLQDACGSEHRLGPNVHYGGAPSTSSGDRQGGTEVIEDPGYVLPTDPESNYSSATSEAIYTTAEIESTYHVNDMAVQLPIAGGASTAGAGSRVINLSRGQCHRVIEVNYERVGAMPAVPAPVKAYKWNGVVAHRRSFRPVMLPPVRSTDGQQKIYRVLAKIVYLLDREPDWTRPLPVGINPVTAFAGQQGTLTLNLTGDQGIRGRLGL